MNQNRHIPLLVKRSVSVTVVEGLSEAIDKDLLPKNFRTCKFETILEDTTDILIGNGLQLANHLNTSFKGLLNQLTSNSIQVEGECFCSQVVGGNKQFMSELMTFRLIKDNVEQELSLHAVLRKPIH